MKPSRPKWTLAGRYWVNFSYPQKAVLLVSLSHKVAFTGVCPLQVAEYITGQLFSATLKSTWTCAASRPDSREKRLSCKDLVTSVSILPDILHDMLVKIILYDMISCKKYNLSFDSIII